ncbi:MAG: lysophospholipid acyltransferase family protein [Opitutales bacterium]
MLHEPLLRFEQTNRHYERLLQVVDTPGRFFDQGLGVLGVTYEVSDEDRGRIPREGPLVTVSNHPYGGVDGLVLGSLLDHRRGDVKLLVNYLLGHIEPFRPHIIEVDPFAGEGAKRRNFGAMRESLRWLREGHSLGLFPSGTVSHYHWRQRQITDPAWAANLAGLIRRSGATVVPVYFEGGNSRLFQLLGLLHPRLRTVLLAGEMMRGKERCIRLRVGSPISPSRLQRFASDEAMMGFLRLKTYILQNRSVAAKTSFRMSFRRRKPAAKEPLAPPVDPASMAAEVDALPVAQRLVESGDFLVCYARAEQIPQLLEEIGRLREVTFRAVEEGTGFARDLDQFDRYYLHLFLWDARHRALAGAYRLGPTDEILAARGPAGLYTTTLFHYRPGVLRGLGPALELGRSFIVAEYQRRHASLGLIWRGIGAFIAQHPRYRVLFGPVSISKEYQSLSKNLMVMYLKEHTLDPELATKVRARKPPRSRNLGRLDRSCFNESVRDIEDVSALISEIEREERGVPVLLRQYLKLNATMLSFNVDPEFNDCIDGLVLVDLAKTNEKTLRRYMGDVGAEAFYAYHETRRSERLAVEQTAEG